MAVTLEELTGALEVPVETETVELLPGMEVTIRPITSFAVLAGIEKQARNRLALLPARPVLYQGEPITVTMEMAQAAVMLSEAIVEPKLTWDMAALLLHRYAVECGRVLSRVNALMGTTIEAEMQETEAALEGNSFQDGEAERQPSLLEAASRRGKHQ